MFDKKESVILVSIVMFVVVLFGSVTVNGSGYLKDLFVSSSSSGFATAGCSADLDGNGLGDACDPSLVLWLEMNGEKDSSMYNNRVRFSKVERVKGPMGNALLCSWAEAIKIAHSDNFNFKGNAFSVSAWVKLNSEKAVHIVNKYASYDKGWTLSYDSSKGVYAFLGDVDAFYGSRVKLSSNEWAHVVSVYNDGVVSFYINGDLITRKDISKDLNVPNFDTDEPIVLCENGAFMSLDEVRIYNRALNSEEIKALASN